MLFRNSGIILLMLVVLITTSCEKDDDNHQPPVISLKSGTEYSQDGSVVMVGRPLKFGIQARGNDAVLTNLTVKKHLPDGNIITVMDTGIYTKYLEIDKVFYQNAEDTADWVFSVQDRDRMSANTSLTIYKDPNSEWGGIRHYPSIIMGYQNNQEHGHFLDPLSGKVWFADSASLMQEQVHMLVYYIVDEELPSPTLSSAGEMDYYSTDAVTFYPDIANWEIRNYTLWDISVDDDPISASDFDNAHNDSLLIVSYDEVWGKKKFKWADPGEVIPFQTNQGKRGLIKIVQADHADDGIIEFELKIQQ